MIELNIRCWCTVRHRGIRIRNEEVIDVIKHEEGDVGGGGGGVGWGSEVLNGRGSCSMTYLQPIQWCYHVYHQILVIFRSCLIGWYQRVGRHSVLESLMR